MLSIVKKYQKYIISDDDLYGDEYRDFVHEIFCTKSNCVKKTPYGCSKLAVVIDKENHEVVCMWRVNRLKKALWKRKSVFRSYCDSF